VENQKMKTPQRWSLVAPRHPIHEIRIFPLTPLLRYIIARRHP